MTAVIDAAVDELVDAGVTRTRACRVLGRARASHYRARQAPTHGPPTPRPRPARALTPDEE